MSKKASKQFRLFWILFILIITFVSSTDVLFATNGYFRHGYGTKNKGLAGAGVALPLNALIAVTNPAGMVFIGRRYDIGFSIFNPNRDYKIIGAPSGFEGTFGLLPGKVDSDAKPFLIPSIGLNWMIDENSSFGVSIFANGGMNTTYPTNTFFGSQPTGVDLSQLFISFTYAHKFAGRHAFGITPIIAAQIFQIRGVEAFANFSSDPQHVSNNGKDTSFGFGLRVGYMANWTDFLSVGASIQTKIYMSTFDSYEGLFAEKGDFDVPLNWVVGLALKPIPVFAFVFDVQRINYSDIQSVGNPMFPNFQTKRLGDDGGPGFGWDDMTVFKFGVQWQATNDWTFRVGYSFGDQPIPASEVLFNILAPGVIEQHATFGFTKSLSSDKEISFALMKAFSKTVRGPNPLDPPAQQIIELRMDQWEIDVSFSWGIK